VVDLVAELEKDTEAKEVNSAFKEAADGSLKGILEFCEEPLVSIDFNNSLFSSSVDGPTTSVIGGNMVKVLSWYDNETGYSARIVDLIDHIGKSL
jgi:glyceraldehyde 3-phosphate dehydrogenase